VKLTKIAVDNPVFATMMMVALLVMGLFSYRQLGIDQFPNVDFPVVVVTTDYPGASPETVETEVSRKIEESVTLDLYFSKDASGLPIAYKNYAAR